MFSFFSSGSFFPCFFISKIVFLTTSHSFCFIHFLESTYSHSLLGILLSTLTQTPEYQKTHLPYPAPLHLLNSTSLNILFENPPIFLLWPASLSRIPSSWHSSSSPLLRPLHSWYSLRFSIHHSSSPPSLHQFHCSPLSKKVSILNHHHGKVAVSFSTRPMQPAPMQRLSPTPPNECPAHPVQRGSTII